MTKVVLTVRPIFILLLWLCFIAAFLTIPIIAFYVLPKALVWLASVIVGELGALVHLRLYVPFNVITWAVAMYILWLTGVIRFATKELKSAVSAVKH